MIRAAVEAWVCSTMLVIASVVGDEVRHEGRTADYQAGRQRRRRHHAADEAGVRAFVVRASERMKAGMPMVNHAAMVTCMGWKG